MTSPESQTSDQARMSSTRQSAARIRGMLSNVRDRARQEIASEQNPKVQALLETTAEVPQGLMKAYEDFERGDEKAWQ